MYRLILYSIVALIIMGCLLFIAAWFDVATSFCHTEHRSYMFNILVSRGTWWLCFLIGFGPLTLLCIMYQKDLLTTK